MRLKNLLLTALLASTSALFSMDAQTEEGRRLKPTQESHELGSPPPPDSTVLKRLESDSSVYSDAGDVTGLEHPALHCDKRVCGTGPFTESEPAAHASTAAAAPAPAAEGKASDAKEGEEGKED